MGWSKGCRAFGLTSVLVTSSPAPGQTGPAISVQCPALGPDQSDELAARARLLISSSPSSARPNEVALRCSADRAELYLDGTSAGPIDRRHGLVEGALDTLESALEPSARPSGPGAEPAAPRTPELPRSRRDPPGAADVQPGPAKEHRRKRLAAGGIGPGVAFEPLPAPLDADIGPRLDLAIGVGQLALFASESLRFALGSGTDAEVFDAQVGIAWGAPFEPSASLGVLGLVGLQWLALADGRQTLRTPTVAAGLRTALGAGPAAVWVGLDGVIRTRPQRSESPTPIAMDSASLVVSVGGFLLADRP